MRDSFIWQSNISLKLCYLHIYNIIIKVIEKKKSEACLTVEHYIGSIVQPLKATCILVLRAQQKGSGVRTSFNTLTQ